VGEQEEAIPSPDEKSAACLAHFLQIIAWFIGPLIVFLVKRESRFVAFHAFQALLWQLILMVVWMLIFVGFFAVMFSTFPEAGAKQPPGPPVAFFVFFPLMWLGMMGLWATTLVLAIVYGIKAMKGEWAAYPIIGRWARRIVGD
jgi:hypothetical protein